MNALPTSCAARHGETALVVLAHAEMLRIRNRKAGDEETMAIAAGVMAADRRQPFPQRRMLIALRILFSASTMSVNFRGTPAGSFSKS